MDKPTRIPAKDSDAFDTWSLPAVEQGNLVDVAARERRARDEAAAREQVLYANLTAGQLEKISNEGYNDGRQQGYREGQAEGQKRGYDDGLKQGLDAAAQQVEQQLGQLRSIMSQLIEPLQDQHAAVEAALVEMAAEMARSLLQRELSGDLQGLENLVQQAVDALPVGSAHIAVHLHPDDHHLLSEQGRLPSDWQLVPDKRVAAGGCQVRADRSLVNFTLEARLRELVAELLNRDPSDPGAAGPAAPQADGPGGAAPRDPQAHPSPQPPSEPGDD